MNHSQRSQFPFSQALAFAIQGIRLRLGRMFLVLAGVAVAIAFTNVLLTTDALFAQLPPAATAEVQGLTGQGVFRLLWVAVALLICTAGTLNAIVMSVTERIKEIGTLKCLGSRDFHIVEIFLFESLLLGVLGGILGGLLGYAGAMLNFIATVGPGLLSWAMALGWQTTRWILISVGISSGLALLASVIPVFMAAKVEPAAAMRYEV